MPRRLIIVGTLLLLAPAGCGMFSQYGPAPPVAPPPTAVVLPPDGSAPMVITGPPIAGAPLLAPGAPAMIGSTVIQQSSILVPAVDRDFMWDQLVDVVDDYFKIEKEDRVRLVGNEPTPGRIDTFPLTGATLLEPWHRDTVNCYERLESTLQSIRRRAFVDVTPYPLGAANPQGYLVDVTVIKELEDVALPIRASAGAATFRYDTSLQRDTEFNVDPNRIPGDPARPNGPRSQPAGWIPLPRDTILEQVMLAKIQSRLGGVITPPVATVTPGPTVLSPATTPPQFVPPGTIVTPGGIPQPQELPQPR
jgi:hypothetical protein